MTKGVILILHSGFSAISRDACVAALPEELKRLDREVIEVAYSELIELDKSFKVSYGQFALEHRRKFGSEILPVLKKKPDYKIIYFGLAQIPLAIDFGQLFHNYRDIEAYQFHHASKTWYQNLSSPLREGNELVPTGIPDQSQKGITQALIRLSVSHPVNPEDTSLLLPNAAEVDLALSSPSEDAIETRAMMDDAVQRVKEVFDMLSANRSGLDEIHLFASIPCGLAFLIGTKISPNIHPYVQTYQYSRTEEPKYVKAILVKAAIAPTRKLSVDEIQKGNDLRKLANEELVGNVKTYCSKNETNSNGKSWLLGLMPALNRISDDPFWTNLPPICQTSLSKDTFDFESKIINDGFFWRGNKWFVDDNFFVALSKRLTPENEVKVAVRLFLFHEALHYTKHRLTDTTSTNIGSFPKVLETADYQADVYALLNEYGYQSSMNGDIVDHKQFFLNAIKIATETMWCFVDVDAPLEEIQIRRLNRFLIWYWQYVRIENDGNSLSDIVRILQEKPSIELNGLQPREEDNRFFFRLEKARDQVLELAAFYNNTVVRDGTASNLPIENLVEGIKKMNGDDITDVLRSLISR